MRYCQKRLDTIKVLEHGVSCEGSWPGNPVIAFSTTNLRNLLQRSTDLDVHVNLDISKGVVVWVDDNSETKWDVYGYNLSTSKNLEIAVLLGYQRHPRISGDFVVWSDEQSDGEQIVNNGFGLSNIYGFNISTGEKFPLVTHSALQTLPEISDNIVVWLDYRKSINSKKGSHSIFGYNLKNKTEFLIVNRENPVTSPDISGNIVVWQEYGNQKIEIYGKDLINEMVFPIVTGFDYSYHPQISGDIIVWTNFSDDDLDIWGAKLKREN